MPTYQYTRVLLGSGGYDINYPGRVTYLAEEVEAALPGKTFRICCYGTTCDIIFDQALTGPEQTTLDGVVATHKVDG